MSKTGLKGSTGGGISKMSNNLLYMTKKEKDDKKKALFKNLTRLWRLKGLCHKVCESVFDRINAIYEKEAIKPCNFYVDDSGNEIWYVETVFFTPSEEYKELVKKWWNYCDISGKYCEQIGKVCNALLLLVPQDDINTDYVIDERPIPRPNSDFLDSPPMGYDLRTNFFPNYCYFEAKEYEQAILANKRGRKNETRSGNNGENRKRNTFAVI